MIHNSKFKIQALPGFTLIEVLIAAAIFAMVMLAAMTIFSRLLVGENTGSSRRLLQQNTRLAMETMSRDIRMGASFDITPTSINISYNDNTNIFYQFKLNNIQRASAPKPGGLLLPADYQVINSSFTGQNANATQPGYVTIDLTVQSIKNPEMTYSLHSTIADRGYRWLGK